MSLLTQLQDAYKCKRPFRENKMASAGAAIWLTDKERLFMELSTMMTRAQQQRNATSNQFDTSEFFVGRLEEYKQALLFVARILTQVYYDEWFFPKCRGSW